MATTRVFGAFQENKNNDLSDHFSSCGGERRHVVWTAVMTRTLLALCKNFAHEMATSPNLTRVFEKISSDLSEILQLNLNSGDGSIVYGRHCQEKWLLILKQHE